MVDYSQMRKKFPVKGKASKQRRDAAIKSIAREYELKRQELGLQAPVLKKGIGFYAVVVIGLMMVGALVLSATGKGGKPRISRADIEARKSVDALAIALGRFRYHTGAYPTTAEGLEALASTQVIKSGWNGPYIRVVVDDPWGREYVYADNGEGKVPTLYSKGPDGIGGTADDYFPAPELFDEPFRDTSWTLSWVPYRLRGYVLAPDEETKKAVEKEVETVLEANKRAAAAARARRAVPLPGVGDGEIEAAAERLTRPAGAVHIATAWSGTEGEDVKVRALAPRATDAALFVNNTEFSRVAVPAAAAEAAATGEAAANDGALEWESVPFEEGEIKVIAWRDGEYLGEDAVRSPGEAMALELKFERAGLGDGETLFALALAVDAAGTPAALKDGEIEFTLSGPGEKVAQMTWRNARIPSAAVGAFRRVGRSGEEIEITASAKGLRPARKNIPWTN